MPRLDSLYRAHTPPLCAQPSCTDAISPHISPYLAALVHRCRESKPDASFLLPLQERHGFDLLLHHEMITLPVQLLTQKHNPGPKTHTHRQSRRERDGDGSQKSALGPGRATARTAL